MAAPSVIRFAFQRLRVTGASFGMEGDFLQELYRFAKTGRLTFF